MTAVFLLAWTLWVTGAVVTALWRRRRLCELGDRPVVSDRSVVLLHRPCTGDAHFLSAGLASVKDAHCSRPLEVRMTVTSEQDPAMPLIESTAEMLRNAGVDATTSVYPASGPNQKAGQLEALLSDIKGVDVVIVADVDVDLTGVDLDRLVNPLVLDRSIGAVWCPPSEHAPPRTFGDRTSQAFLNGSLHAFSLLCALDPGGLVGKLFAFRLESMRSAVSLELLPFYLGEDMEISRRLRRSGSSVRPIPLVARSMASGRRLSDVIDRFSRWLLVIRSQRPLLLLAYPLMFGATLPIVLFGVSLAVLGSGSASWIGLTAAIIAFATRLFTALAARRFASLSPRPMSLVVDALLGELLIWIAFISALTRRRVQWAGRTLRIDGAGRLVRDPGS